MTSWKSWSSHARAGVPGACRDGSGGGGAEGVTRARGARGARFAVLGGTLGGTCRFCAGTRARTTSAAGRKLLLVREVSANASSSSSAEASRGLLCGGACFRADAALATGATDEVGSNTRFGTCAGFGGRGAVGWPAVSAMLWFFCEPHTRGSGGVGVPSRACVLRWPHTRIRRSTPPSDRVGQRLPALLVNPAQQQQSVIGRADGGAEGRASHTLFAQVGIDLRER